MKRQILAKFFHWKQKRGRKPLLLKGARQVGKTYILKVFGKENFPAFHILNFEKEKGALSIFEKDLRTDRILNELSLYWNKPIDTKQDLLILDEIQECPAALTSLKYFQEEKPELALCAAGSLLGVHYGESSFPVGKVDFLTMFPMCFAEFLEGIGEIHLSNLLASLAYEGDIPDVAHQRLWELMKIYFVVGGLPEVVVTYQNLKENLWEALQEVRKKQNDLILAYNADMAKHSGKVNAMHIERLWRNIPEQLAKEQNGSAGRFRFKGVLPGMKRYEKMAGPIDWLEAAGLILKVLIIHKGLLPFSAYTKENTFKLFSFDVGLLGAISQLPPKTILDYDYGTYKGFFAENFVAQELVCAGEEKLYSWREGQAEVEFLKEVDGKIFPLEVKAGWVTQSKSLKMFEQKYHPPFGTILSGKSLQWKDKRHYYPLYLAGKFPLLPTSV